MTIQCKWDDSDDGAENAKGLHSVREQGIVTNLISRRRKLSAGDDTG